MTFALRIFTALTILTCGVFGVYFLLECFWEGDFVRKTTKLLVSILKTLVMIIVIYTTIMFIVGVFICN